MIHSNSICLNILLVFAMFQLGHGETQRLASKFSSGVANAMQMVTLLLPGTPIVFYGDEIGLRDVPLSAGGNRSFAPMQWNSSINAGVYHSISEVKEERTNYQIHFPITFYLL